MLSEKINLFNKRTKSFIYHEKEEERLRFSRLFQTIKDSKTNNNISPERIKYAINKICLTNLYIENVNYGFSNKYSVTVKMGIKSKNIALPTTLIFKNGDICRIYTSKNQYKEGIIYKITKWKIVISLNEPLMNKNNTRVKLYKVTNEKTYKIYESTLEKLNSPLIYNKSKLVKIIFNTWKPTSFNDDIKTKINFFNEKLNKEQKEAVIYGINASELAIIHGPPGTGKTTVIIEIIRQMLKLNKKLLVCAPSNPAVDNIAEMLLDVDSKITRIGHPARYSSRIEKLSLEHQITASDHNNTCSHLRNRINEIIKQFQSKSSTKNFKELQKEMNLLKRNLYNHESILIKDTINSSNIILSTLTSTDGTIMSKNYTKFDLVIIDEASQALEIACWIAFLKTEKAILVGDHKQLPPTILSATAKNLSANLFEDLIQRFDNKILRTQYRMNKTIMNWPSQEMYNNLLKADETVKNHLLSYKTNIEINEITNSPLIFIDTAECKMEEKLDILTGSHYNINEAKVAVEHYCLLLSSGVRAKDCAIISPYKSQIKVIEKIIEINGIDKNEGNNDIEKKLYIGTVDGFQGREKEAVIITTVRSNKEGKLGFLTDKRRMNVAITRAKRSCVIIMDTNTGSKNEFIKSLINYYKINAVCKKANEYNISQYNFNENTIFGYKNINKSSVIEKCNTKNNSYKDILIKTSNNKEYYKNINKNNLFDILENSEEEDKKNENELKIIYNKNKAKIKSPPEEDLDKLLKKFELSPKDLSLCKSKNCKKSVIILFDICQFCKHKFCFKHSNPLFHGCEKEAKAFYRRNRNI